MWTNAFHRYTFGSKKTYLSLAKIYLTARDVRVVSTVRVSLKAVAHSASPTYSLREQRIQPRQRSMQDYKRFERVGITVSAAEKSMWLSTLRSQHLYS
jgi:hypothetical protein